MRYIAVAGHGQLGTYIVAALNNAGYKVTILTRSKLHIATVPASISVSEVDYSSIDSLYHALQGQDVLVASLATDAISVQHKLLKAACLAGVKRFFPSEYSGMSLHPSTSWLLPYAPIVDIQRAVQKAAHEGKIEYTIIAPGGFLNVMFNTPHMLDWEAKRVRMYDGGENKMSISRLSTIAQAIVGAIGKGEEYINKIVKVHDCIVTQKQLLAMTKSQDQGAQWEESHVDVDAFISELLEIRVREGDTPDLIGKMLVSKAMSKNEPLFWDEVENARLGIEELSLEQLSDFVKQRVRGEIVDTVRDYSQAWNVTIQ